MTWKNILNELNNKKTIFPDNAVVFVPYPPGSNSIDFMQKYYGNKNTIYIYFDINWKNKIPANTPIENIFVYDIIFSTFGRTLHHAVFFKIGRKPFLNPSSIHICG